jgi:hypothetical protein|tara:strand:+ start:422 stop:640 length:219 start_codon:yes stop_codon:yes gene_type:complete
MQKYNFFTNTQINKNFEIKKLTTNQKKILVNKVDINTLLNRVKVSKKNEYIKKIKLIGISLLIISTTVLVVI